jgi:hypothetical protein
MSADTNETKVDLVSATVMTKLASRLYRIADGCCQMGLVVVLGGIQGTLTPEKVLQHVGVVVVGLDCAI